jgi:hypothetical protein
MTMIGVQMTSVTPVLGATPSLSTALMMISVPQIPAIQIQTNAIISQSPAMIITNAPPTIAIHPQEAVFTVKSHVTITMHALTMIVNPTLDVPTLFILAMITMHVPMTHVIT